MNHNLFQVLLTSIKTKITPLVTKVRRWTDWNYLRTQGINKVRQFFTAIFDVRPKHKKDYYEVFGWLVSKKLAFAIVVVIGVLSLYYLASVKDSFLPDRKGVDGGIKTYSYDSVMLRFAKDKVRIKGKSGYLAYEGNVAKGYVTGTGTLYNPEGTVVYQGSFDKNKYEGDGVAYYDTGVMKYNGKFSENLYEGEGKQYRENGSLLYAGMFARGMKEGEGTLYDQGSNEVYKGNFSKDGIVYSDLLGKTAKEVSDCYSGSMKLYRGENRYAVVLTDIEAMYVGATESNSLYDDVKVDNVYVLQPYFRAGQSNLTTIAELKGLFGDPIYEGNSEVTMEEAVAINRLCDEKDVLFGPVDWKKTDEYDEYSIIDSYDSSYVVYLYGFEKDGLVYTFVCSDKNDVFAFYYITKGEGA